jgi:7-cyano-7-deazaguanine synthase
MNQRIVVSFSGGVDSTTLAYHLREQGHELLALSVDYGQRHRVELERAGELARDLGLRHEVADLRPMARLLSGSSLTDSAIDVPLGHYEAPSMRATVVPNRNMILLAVAGGWALSQGADAVAYAAHAGDHAIYPDCRPEFADAVAQALALADWRELRLLRPFVHLSKAQIVARAAELRVPLDRTWSCYRGGDRHCGACGTCVERREAFLLAGLADPTDYEPLAPALVLAGEGRYAIDWTHTITGAATGAKTGVTTGGRLESPEKPAGTP